MSILGSLRQLGMSTKEVKLYLKLLEMGSCGASTLAQKLEENRTSTYSLLAAMVSKGFASYVTKNKVKYYSAADPQFLINHYCENAKQLKEVLPELLAIHNKFGQKPRITFYEGVKGIVQICETLLEVPGSTRESFMGIDPKTIHPEIKRYFEESFLNRRIELGIKYRGIVNGILPMGTRYAKGEASQLRELKFIDPKKFSMNIHIDIFPRNKVAIYSYNREEMMGVIIEHQSFYDTMRTVFRLAWAGADVVA